MFAVNAVDSDTASRPLPPNGAVIHGHSGGGKPAYASITIHPSRAAKLLPAASGELTDRQKSLMCVFARYNSRGRADWFTRHGKAAEWELVELESKGWVKRNKAGAVTCTAAGRNIAPSDTWLYKSGQGL